MLLYLLPHLLSLLVTSLLTGFMISRRNMPGFKRMGAVFFGMAGYSFAFLCKTLAPLLAEKIFWDYVEYAWLILISICLLLFVMDYIEFKIANSLRLYGSLFILPAIISILLLTNDFQGGFRPDAALISSGPGIFLSYHIQLADDLAAIYLALYQIIAIGVLALHTRKQPPAFRGLSYAIIAGLAIPIFNGIAIIGGLNMGGQGDFMTILFAISDLVITWGLIRYAPYLHILPIAREWVFTRTSDAVITLDARDRIQDVNPAALTLFERTGKALINQPISSLLGGFKDMDWVSHDQEYKFNFAHALKDGRKIHFDILSIPVRNPLKRYAGRMLILHDVTELFTSEAGLRKNQDVLEQSVKDRTEDIEKVYELAIHLANLGSDQDLDKILATQIKALTGAFLVTITEYLPEKQVLETRWLAVEDTILAEINRLSGTDQRRLAYPINEEAMRLIMSEPVSYPRDLSEATFGVISPQASRMIQNLLSLDMIIWTAIHVEGQLLGMFVICLQKDSPTPSEQILRATGRIAAIAFRRRKAEQGRIESEHRFEELTELLPQPVFECDLNGRLTFCNKIALELFGYTLDDVAAGIDVISLVHDSFREELQNRFAHVLASGSPSNGFEFLARRKDGSHFPAVVYITISRRSQEVAGLVGVIFDITERQRAEMVLRASEETFRTTIEQITEGFVLLDSQGRVSEANLAYQKITGLAREALIGLPFWEVQGMLIAPERRTPDHDQYLKEVVTEALKNKVSPIFDRPVEWVIQTATDGEHFIQQTIFPVITEKEYRIGAVSHDVTRQKRVQHTLERYARRMEILHEIDQAILTARSAEEIAQAALKGIGRMIPLDQSVVMLIDEAVITVKPIAVIQNTAVEGSPALGSCPLLASANFWNSLSSDEMTLIDDVSQFPLTRDVCEGCRGPRKHTLISLPLNSKGKRVGMLSICASDPKAFNSENLEIAEEIASQLAIVIQQGQLFDQTTHALERERRLNQLSQMINTSLDLDVLIPVFLKMASQLIDADGAALAILSSDNQFPKNYAYPPQLDSPVESLKAQRVDQTGLTQEVILANQPMLLSNYSTHPNADPFWVSMGVNAIIGLPISVSGKVLGGLAIYRLSSDRPFSQRDLDLAQSIAAQAGLTIRNAQLYEGLEQAYDATIQGWARALELRDSETKGHSDRVIDLTLALAKRCNFPEKDMVHLKRGVFLHDIGKMSIPDSIMLNPGRLTAEEWLVMREHPRRAKELIESINYLKPAIDIPYCHHEKWNGGGYPRGLKGEQIPLAARIFSVVDVWDALTKPRVYRPEAWSAETTRAYIQERAGSEFDPAVVTAFMALLDELENEIAL